MAFEITTSHQTITLQLSGNIDLSETGDIKESLMQEPKSGFTDLVIQGSDIEYIDSSGVAVLLFSKKLAEESGLKFKIESLSDNASKVIQLAGLGSIFKIQETKKDSPNSEEKNTNLDDIDLNLDNLFK